MNRHRLIVAAAVAAAATIATIPLIPAGSASAQTCFASYGRCVSTNNTCKHLCNFIDKPYRNERTPHT